MVSTHSSTMSKMTSRTGRTLFMLPTIYPITVKNFNYTVVAVLVVLGGAWLYWAVSAKNWFTGPRQNIDDADIPAPPTAADDSPVAATATEQPTVLESE